MGSPQAAQHEYDIKIPAKSPFSVSPRFGPLSYGTSHLENPGVPCYYKATKRSESNVLTNLHSKESRGYANEGTRQFLKPLMSEIRGFLFALFMPQKKPDS